MFTVTISTDNAAFEGESLRPEIARILEKVAGQVRTLPEGWDAVDEWQRAILDINGNVVGRWELESPA